MIARVVTDSRQAGPGSLFVALPGERTDGVRFVPEAFRARRRRCDRARRASRLPGPRSCVASTGDALLRLAAAERRSPSATCVGITGANGKTSTKDMAAAVLSRRHPHPREPGLVQQRDRSADDAARRAAGHRGGGRRARGASQGRRRRCCARSRGPTSSSSRTSASRTSRSSDRGRRSWRPRRSRSTRSPAGGWAVLNADDPVVAGYRSRCRRPGRDVRLCMPSADVRARRGRRSAPTAIAPVRRDRRMTHRAPVTPRGRRASTWWRTPWRRRRWVASSGCRSTTAPRRSASARVSRWRMETFTTADGVRVVNDAYNANPESMAAALKAARVMARDGAADRRCSVTWRSSARSPTRSTSASATSPPGSGRSARHRGGAGRPIACRGGPRRRGAR